MLLGSAGLLPADEWPQWRGPARNGSAADSPPLIDSLPAAGPPRLWHYACPGGPNGGLGSIAVANDRVYLYVSWRDQRAGTIADTFLCLDAHDGKEVWKTQFPGTVVGGEGCSGTPCVAGDRVYIAGSAGKGYCFSAADGKLIWEAKLGSVANHSSFLVAGGLALIASNNLTALDASTGILVWETAHVRSCESSPALWRHDGKSYIICHDTNRDTGCFDLKTGELKWKAPGKGYPSVVIDGDHMISRSDTGTACFKLSPQGAELLWTAPIDTGGVTPIVHGGFVYAIGVHDRLMACLNLADGKQAWKQEIGECQFSSPIYADGRIFAVVEKKNLLLLSASPDKAQVLGKSALGIQYFTSPAIASGKLYLRLESGIACFDVRASASSASLPAAATAATTHATPRR